MNRPRTGRRITPLQVHADDAAFRPNPSKKYQNNRSLYADTLCIEDDRTVILTHPRGRRFVEQRAERLAADFDYFEALEQTP